MANSTTASTDLTVTETDTLASLRDKINALNYGVTASIVGAGDGTFNIVLKTETGVKNALRITATETPSGSGLSSIDNSTTNASKQKIAGADASIVVDGMALTRSTNIINDLFDGYEVSLLNTTSSSAKLTSEVDVSEATSNLQNFIDAVNATRTILNDKTYRGSSSEEAGELAADPVIKSLKKRIESFTSSALSGFGSKLTKTSSIFARSSHVSPIPIIPPQHTLIPASLTFLMVFSLSSKVLVDMIFL